MPVGGGSRDTEMIPKRAAGLGFTVRRTASKQQPVYVEYKQGGNKVQTRIRKIEGDAKLLHNIIRDKLDLPQDCIRVNHVTNDLLLKGNAKSQVCRILDGMGADGYVH